MRRAEVDACSQPVRNLHTNPSSENPSSLVTVRTNHVPNPSPQTNLTNWNARWYGSTGGTGVNSRNAGTGLFGGFSYRKTWSTANTGGAADTGVGVGGIPVTAGTTYTFSGHMKSSVLQNCSIFVTWRDSGGATLSNSSRPAATPAPAGTWVRPSTTVIAPANAVTAEIVVGPYDSANPMAVGDTLDFDCFLAESSAVILPYFDGATAAAGDYTHTWSGSAYVSSSIQQATSPTGFSSQNAVTVRSSEWSASGSYSARVVPTHATSNDSASILSYAWVAGKTYTVLAKCRMSAALTGSQSGNGSRQIWAVGTGGTSTSVRSTQQANSAGVEIHRITFTFQPTNTFMQVRLYTGVARGGGDTWWDDIMIVEGVYNGDFIDGAKPFSKWDGTANASTSVGYPPQLLDIAGKPFTDLTGVATFPSTPVDPYVARTMYFVYEVTDQTTNFGALFTYGITSTSRFVLQSGSAGSNDMAPRADFVNGSINSVQAITNGRVTKRHLVTVTVAQGLASADFHLNGTFMATKAYSPGDGWADGRLIAAVAGTMKPLRALVYHTAHTATERQAVSRYLGNKYGANVS